MGVDYRYSDQFVLGGALNYISTNSDYLSRSSTLDIDGYSLSLYGSYYQSEQVFIDSILSIGLNNYDSQREFTTGGINHDLKGDTDGAEYAFSLGGGYEFNYQNLSFVPQARVNYLHVKVDSYDESSSGSGLNLSIDDQDIESLITSISGNLSLAYSTQYGVFIPYLSIEWAHEFENDSRAIIAHFVNDPTKTNFSVLTDDPDQDYFFLGLGVSAAMANGKSAFLHYEQMLDHSDTSQYTVTAGFRLEF
jgi:outer membrane lipase/esterase